MTTLDLQRVVDALSTTRFRPQLERQPDRDDLHLVRATDDLELYERITIFTPSGRPGLLVKGDSLSIALAVCVVSHVDLQFGGLLQYGQYGDLWDGKVWFGSEGDFERWTTQLAVEGPMLSAAHAQRRGPDLLASTAPLRAAAVRAWTDHQDLLLHAPEDPAEVLGRLLSEQQATALSRLTGMLFLSGPPGFQREHQLALAAFLLDEDSELVALGQPGVKLRTLGRMQDVPSTAVGKVRLLVDTLVRHRERTATARA